jgi:hypothetical protein
MPRPRPNTHGTEPRFSLEAAKEVQSRGQGKPEVTTDAAAAEYSSPQISSRRCI